MQHIDVLLENAINVETWKQYQHDYIENLSVIVTKLHSQILDTQENLKKLKSNIKTWGKFPLYTRKDGRSDTLLSIDDRTTKKLRRDEQCHETSELIQTIIFDNFCLFFDQIPKDERVQEFKSRNDHDKYQLFRHYESYVDQLVLEEITDAVNNSLKYILFEMDNRYNHNSPTFEVKMDLQKNEIVFIPNLTDDSDGSFVQLIIELLDDIFKMASKIKRVIPSEGEHFIDENYNGKHLNKKFQMLMKHFIILTEFLATNPRLDKMKEKIIVLVKKTINNAVNYNKKYVEYQYLWTSDREQVLKYFLKYCKTIYSDDADLTGMTEKIPTLEDFKDQV